MQSEFTITNCSSLLIDIDNSTAGQAGERLFADWTRLLAEGDDGAWNWFHARYYVALLRYAAHRSGDASAASEIVQHA